MTLRIKEIAKRKGIKLFELAEKIDVDKVTLSRMINGNPTLSTLERIANVLEVDVSDLFEAHKNLSEKEALQRIRDIADHQLKKG